MRIGGLVKSSLNDYPGKIAAVVFTQGCNFRCGYCHNPELVLPDKYTPGISEREVCDFLESRRGKLDAVTVTGGEPTYHSDLADFFKKIKELGFLAKLDTNGAQPFVIQNLINQKLIDYIAMDIKAPFENYREIINVPINVDSLRNSVGIIIDSHLPHEFRTTVVKSLTSVEDLRKIAKEIRRADNYFLQRFIPAVKLNDQKFRKEISYSEKELKKLASELETFVKHCGVR